MQPLLKKDMRQVAIYLVKNFKPEYEYCNVEKISLTHWSFLMPRRKIIMYCGTSDKLSHT